MTFLESSRFREEVGSAVAELERTTSAELVVAGVSSVRGYLEFPLLVGLAAAAVAHAGLVLSPAVVGDYLLLAGPVLAFALAAAAARLVGPFRRRLVGRGRLRRDVEILARATFQKAGLHRTRHATGLLVFLAPAEHECVIVGDLGVTAAFDDAELRERERAFVRALAARDPVPAVLVALAELGPRLAERVPVRDDDVDELPSRIEVSFG